MKKFFNAIWWMIVTAICPQAGIEEVNKQNSMERDDHDKRNII